MKNILTKIFKAPKKKDLIARIEVLERENNRLQTKLTDDNKKHNDYVNQQQQNFEISNALIQGLGQTGIGIDIVSVKYEILYQNQHFIDMFGSGIGSKCYEVYKALNQPCEDCIMEGVLETGQTIQKQISDKNGRIYQLISSPIKNPGGEIDKVIEVIIDITEKKKIEDHIVESELKFRTLYETSPDAIVFRDKDNKIIDVNLAFTAITGYTKEEVIGKTPLDLDIYYNKNDYYNILKQLLTEGKYSNYQIQYKVKDGSIKVGLSSGVTLNVNGELHSLSITKDITDFLESEFENQSLEAQLLQSQKLEILGSLAGGIAHDLNNILTPILGYAELLLLFKDQKEPNFDHIKLIYNAALKAKDLVYQILIFARKDNTEKMPQDIIPIIEHNYKLLRGAIPSTIDINKIIDAKSTIINCNATQIDQILSNLITNAYHSIKDMKGTIDILVTNHVLLNDEPELAKGKYLLIKIKDTGTGINPSAGNKIFEPFYTTKNPEQGTGLGLAVTHGIVKSHKGIISYTSEVGIGSEFSIYLPISKKTKKDNLHFDTKIKTGTENIVLIDDEDTNLKLYETFLNNQGYNVKIYHRAKPFLNDYLSQKLELDLLITDQTMPEMTGLELVKKLREKGYEKPIMVMTGLSDLDFKSKINKSPELNIYKVIEKPIISFRYLGNLIRKALDK